VAAVGEVARFCGCACGLLVGGGRPRGLLLAGSLRLRRFCPVAIDQGVPDESTVGRLTRRLAAVTVAGAVAAGDRGGGGTRVRARAVGAGCDRGGGGRALPDRPGAGGGRGADARRRGRAAGRRAGRDGGDDRGSLAGGERAAAGDRAHAAPRDGRGEGRAAGADGPDGEAARRVGAEARRVAAEAKRCERVVGRIRARLAGKPIKDRLVSPFDPDARPIRRRKPGKTTEFGSPRRAPRAGSHTRNAATGRPAAAPTAARASAPAPAGRHSPTTSTPTRRTPDRSTSRSTQNRNSRRSPCSSYFSHPTAARPPADVYPGEVATRILR
jgi:hypothetical protein